MVHNTAHNRLTVLIIFPLILLKLITAQMLSIEKQELQKVYLTYKHSGTHIGHYNAEIKRSIPYSHTKLLHL